MHQLPQQSGERIPRVLFSGPPGNILGLYRDECRCMSPSYDWAARSLFWPGNLRLHIQQQVPIRAEGAFKPQRHFR